MAEDADPSPGKIRVKITCPLSPVVDIEVQSVLVPALQGPRLILLNRAPLFCQLSLGEVILYRDNHPPLTYLVSRGVCEVRRNICAIMAWGLRPDEIHPDKIQTLLHEAESALPTLISPTAQHELQTRIDFYHYLLTLMALY